MAGALNVWLAGPRRYGNRMRQARRFNDSGNEADAAAILASLTMLRMAQGLFALMLVPPAVLAAIACFSVANESLLASPHALCL